MKGVILAGGTGTRLHPLTLAVSKQLLPVYDKPLIYYPISTLMLMGIREILIIYNESEGNKFQSLLGDGSKWGVKFDYAAQPRPDGIAQALLIAEAFLDEQPFALILGDNIFHGPGLGSSLQRLSSTRGASVLAHKVSSPQAYGVIELDDEGHPVSIEEKPVHPKSSFAVPGLYVFSPKAIEVARGLSPSKRGELEITDVISFFLEAESLDVILLQRGTSWLDAGTFENLIEAGEFVRIVEKRQGQKIGCPEEIAWRMGYIDDDQLRELASKFIKSGYGEYLSKLLSSQH